MLATAIIVAAPFAAGTIALTSAFSADEVAQISIGQSDVRARTTQFQVGARDDAPQPGSGGITEVLEDRDLAVNVAGESSQLSMTGRWLEYRAPLADGILTFRESSSGPAEVALSASAQSELGVALGDEVVILGSDVSLTVTDIVAYAPDTAAPLIVINPEAVTSDEADALLADSGSVRWLLATDDLDATLGELESLGLIAETRTALTAFEGAELVNPIAVAAVCGIAGIVILAAAGAARSGSRRRIVQTLNRLGTTSSEANAVTRIESVVVTGAGAVLAGPLGLGLAWLGRALGESVSDQLWGRLDPAWLTYVIACAVALVVAPGLAIAGTRDPHREWRPKSLRAPRRVGAALIGRRMAWQRVQGARTGGLAVGLIIALAGSGILIGQFVRDSTQMYYEPQVPGDLVAIGLGRPLTDSELRKLEAATGSVAIEARRAQLNDSLVVVDSAATRCLSDPSNDPFYCADTVGATQDFVVVVEPAQLEMFLGRELSAEERTALNSGDGILMGHPRDNPRLVYSGSAQADSAGSGDKNFSRDIDPVVIDGYAGYARVPALLIAPEVLDEWAMTLESTEISHYLLSPHTGPLSEATVRAALPDGVSASADVIMDSENANDARHAATQQTIVALATGLVFLVVTLLVFAWVAGSSDTLRRLSRLGAPMRMVVAVVLARGSRSVLPAAVVGTGGTALLTWAFSSYVGVTIPIAGWMWLTPGLVAVVALPVATLVRLHFAREFVT